MNTIARGFLAGASLALMLATGTVSAAGPGFVDITWMSISNMYYELGQLNIVTDGYITRLPQDCLLWRWRRLAQTRRSYKPDVAAVTRVMNALGGPARVNLLLTGHSHWDHSFDTATWSKLTGARIIGSKTTCLQAQAEGVAVERCRVVEGREAIPLAEGVTMRVVRWNHSGDPAVNPEQHNPVELSAVPSRIRRRAAFARASQRTFRTVEATAHISSPSMDPTEPSAGSSTIRRARSISTCRLSSMESTTERRSRISHGQ